MAIPEDIGRFYTVHDFKQVGSDLEDEVSATIPCKEAFSDIYATLSEHEQDLIEYGQCMDPATARTEGNESFGVTIVPSIIFENCSERQAKDQATDLKCRDKEGIRQFVRKYKLDV